MSILLKYFDSITYKPKYFLGDRVQGKWNKIPFVGTVANDTEINDEGPNVHIFLDLPVTYKNTIHTIITVKHRDIKKLPIIKD